ncbi:MAG: hypothetical protein FWF01_04490 [Alphaproteobacteria bacterium]|nr:hypothetical protein [Alphaproteobacteria bacterium]
MSKEDNSSDLPKRGISFVDFFERTTEGIFGWRRKAEPSADNPANQQGQPEPEPMVNNMPEPPPTRGRFRSFFEDFGMTTREYIDRFFRNFSKTPSNPLPGDPSTNIEQRVDSVDTSGVVARLPTEAQHNLIVQTQLTNAEIAARAQAARDAGARATNPGPRVTNTPTPRQPQPTVLPTTTQSPTGARNRQQLIDIATQDIKNHEGGIPHIYCDPNGHPTIGYGRLLGRREDILAGRSNARNNYIDLMINMGIRVSRDELGQEFDRVFNNRLSARDASPDSRFRLNQTQMDQMLRQDLSTHIGRLENNLRDNNIHNLYDMPASAQKALIDIVFQNGSLRTNARGQIGNRHRALVEALRRGDYADAANYVNNGRNFNNRRDQNRRDWMLAAGNERQQHIHLAQQRQQGGLG